MILSKILFMKSPFLLFILAFSAPLLTKAQDQTLGKSREQIRAIVNQSEGIKLLKGSNCDTLVLEGGLKSFIFYKNDTCYTSKSFLPIKYLDIIITKMKTDSYQQIGENTWLNLNRTVSVQIFILKQGDEVMVEALLTENKHEK